ncbi:MAG: DEAD/DEAH box helicase [Acidobacteriota bacterium]|nr:DEAD/DEAH box helicase [Acidobacteriota bacterium]
MARGAEYFHGGRVRLEIDEPRARASVTDTNAEGEEHTTYRVGIDWEQVATRRVHTYCECPHFADGQLCGHIWAVLLALGETGPEHQPPGRDRLGLRKDRISKWEDLAEFVGGRRVRPLPNDRSPEPARPAASVYVAPRPRARSASAARRGRSTAISWRSHLASLSDQLATTSSHTIATVSPATRSTLSLEFAINAAASLNTSGLVLDVFGRTISASGKPGKVKRASVQHKDLERLLLPPRPNGNSATVPGEALTLITELPATPPRRKTLSRKTNAPAGLRSLRLPHRLYDPVLHHLCAQRTLSMWDGRSQTTLQPLRWDSGSAWHLALHLDVNSAGIARLNGALERNGERVPLSDPVLILSPDNPTSNETGPSLVVFAETVGRLKLDRRRDLPWIKLLRDETELVIPKSEVGNALSDLLELPALPRLELPASLGLAEESDPPRPRLAFEPVSTPGYTNPPLAAELSFDYGSSRVGAEDSRSSIVDWEERTVLRRDLNREHAALVRLLELGLRAVESSDGGVQALELDRRMLPAVIEPLLQEDWTIEVEGRSVRSPSPPTLRIESGIDWFDLSGEVDFANDRLELSKVLDVVSRGDRFIQLDDGSQGLLPASWMETYDSLAKVARESTDSGLRFLFSQALIVDALLTAMPPADVDATFTRLRQKLSSFERIKPKKEPRGFQGELRSYQRHGLGWLNFLREFGLGGVLADDMGLGKTVQVLALLLTHRAPSKTTKLPYLVVAPRSVVYNWIDEAARFTPKLRVVEYRGVGREELQDRFDEFDIIVTTYGTLRRDISYLATVEFDTVILDEAQAIKNPASQTAKASRLLMARNRLALTGTPIENHLGELGSIFEFLNPDLLGRLLRLEVLTAGRTPSKDELAQLAEDLRPFILRRTKAQVLPDLPPKTEQVLLCTMRSEQREIYDRLRASYQVSLMEQVETGGVSGSAIQVLEALLRLRQVACHPGLVDPSWEEAGSTKLETLFEQVSEVLDEGHKVLIFSQFTTLLGYVRRHLDEQEMPYAYLDGKTRNRAEVVERFQTEPDCNLFLISLKAGGVGLNLTAAGYVFLLDPWWNPAVEAQAIDRTHRIGQTQPVFAYRMIARDTVEEKLLELQRAKRDLADAILEGEGKSLRDLTADDLRMLLS